MSALVLVVVIALSGSALLRARLRGESDTPPALTDIIAGLLAWVTVAALGAAIVIQVFRWLTPGATIPPPLVGAIAGMSLAVVVSGGRRVAQALFAWATRRPLEFDHAAFALRMSLFLVLGFSAVGAASAWASTVLPGRTMLLLLPAFVAALPLFQAVVLPWLTLLSAPTLKAFPDVPWAGDVHTWFEALCRSRDVRRVRLRVQPGGLKNAYVVGGLFGHWVVVGEGLLREMEMGEVKGILAHELAHVLRADVRLYVGVATVSGTCYALALPVVFRLWQEGWMVAGAVVAAGVGALLFGAMPGWVSRRAEYGADSLAASLMGDSGRSLASGLTSLARMKGYSTSQESLTHPSVASRIRALGLDPA